jgi:ferritin-like metal-binding protein YciE
MSVEQLVAWLNDAHAMESGLIPLLQHHANDARAAMPDAAVRLDQHVVETRLHVDRIEQCLQELDATPSKSKSTFWSTLGGGAERTATGIFSDPQVKNALLAHGAEQLEIGCYRAIMAAARRLGEHRVADLCELNLREDEAMALWLRDHISRVVTRAIGLSV